MINNIDKSVGAVLVSYDWNKVLIVRTDNHYGFPKGHSENNETEIYTMKREIHEEIGIDLISPKILGRFEISFPIYNTNIKRIIVCYLVNYNENIPLTIQKTEIDEAKWVSWKDALELLKNSKQYLILIEAIKLSIIYKFKIKNIFSKIKYNDKIIIEHNTLKKHTIEQNFNFNYSKYYLGYNIIIDIFINGININELKIYKLKYISKIYNVSKYNLHIFNLNTIYQKYNGLELKYLKNPLGFIWNLNNLEKIYIL